MKYNLKQGPYVRQLCAAYLLRHSSLLIFFVTAAVFFLFKSMLAAFVTGAAVLPILSIDWY